MASEVPARFAQLISEITAWLDGRAVDGALESALNDHFPIDHGLANELQTLCRDGCAEGWLCTREAGGIRFGRVIKPGPATHGFSVDVVDMDDVVGPHHIHPAGEIDLVMPFDGAARFDGVANGWKVYEPGSAHYPTVAGGRALILYLLPEGQIEFSRA